MFWKRITDNHRITKNIDPQSKAEKEDTELLTLNSLRNPGGVPATEDWNTFSLATVKLKVSVQYCVSYFLALFIYLPLARISLAIEFLGIKVNSIPLSYYSNKSFYTMRTDSLDRFGTRLEKRFSKSEIKLMMKEAGLERIKFSDSEPYWVALGYKSGQ